MAEVEPCTTAPETSETNPEVPPESSPQGDPEPKTEQIAQENSNNHDETSAKEAEFVSPISILFSEHTASATEFEQSSEQTEFEQSSATSREPTELTKSSSVSSLERKKKKKKKKKGAQASSTPMKAVALNESPSLRQDKTQLVYFFSTLNSV